LNQILSKNKTMSNRNDIRFSSEELSHYSRHLTIPEFGLDGQKKLKAGKVLAVGTGGLGAPMLYYLAAAGVGTIGLVDFDRVDASNLHRQILFGVSDVGRPKVEAARERLQEINPHINIVVHETRLTSENALEIMKDYDVVADGTDNFPTRYLINDATVMLDKPNVHGSIFQFEGQLSVFNYVDKEGSRGPNYRDLFPEPPPPGLVPDCAEAGVLGVLPGIIGSLQANEVIKIIAGIGEPLAGRLFLFDALRFSTRTVGIKKNKNNPLTGEKKTITKLIDYEAFCGVGGNTIEDEVPEITVLEFKDLLTRGEDVQLIDVREPYEYEIAQMGGELIPLNTILDQADKIRRDTKVVVHCRSGKRSATAIHQLMEAHGFDNLYNLKGGILAWSEEVDQNVPQY
jgi:sulfur-carrier protein adenylyltransferase/sulfurtransferase